MLFACGYLQRETANSPAHVLAGLLSFALPPGQPAPCKRYGRAATSKFLMRSQSASPTRVLDQEGAIEEDDDGVLFGSRCNKRVFFPGSNGQTAAVAADIFGAHQRTQVKNPLHALGLFPSSPYAVLRKSVPLAVAAAQHEKPTARERRSNSPGQQPSPTSAANGAFCKDVCAPLEPLWTTAAATACGGKRYPSPAPRRYQQTACEIYSPHRLQRSRGRYRRNVEADPRSSTCIVGDETFGEDPSAVVLLEKIRTKEKATGEEAAQLRLEADASVMIRRFWRYSG